MAEEKDLVKSDSGLGAIKIADEVVSIIAGLAATEIDGIAGMSGGVVGGIAEMLGRKNFSKGVKVEVGDVEAAVDCLSSSNTAREFPTLHWRLKRISNVQSRL